MLVGGVWLATLGFRFGGFIAVSGILAAWIASLAQLVRRLHDRNRSGYWLAALLLSTFISYGLEVYGKTFPYLIPITVVVLLPFSLWFTIETLFRNGTAGPNRYGPDPRATRDATTTSV
jgi:uncharacterized membrane protein YhaH (DUF805 family)